MTTANAPDFSAPLVGGRNHFLLRRLHSLTGLVFGGYLVVHLLVNATIAQFGNVYQVQVNKIHELPLLWAIEWALIYLPILYHTIYGIWIVITGQPNATRYPYAKNWFYVLQRVSAIIIVLFMFFHVFALKVGLFGSNLSFDHENAAATVHRHMMYAWYVPYLIYPIGIVASCYHLANGVWTAAITWGVTISESAQRRFGLVCTGLFVITMIFGFTALVASLNPRLEQSPKAGTVEVLGT